MSGIALNDAQGDIGRLLGDAAGEASGQDVADRGGHPQRDLAAPFRGPVFYVVERLAHLPHRSGDMLAQFLSRWGELHAPAVAVEQRRPGFLLQDAHLATERWLRDPDPVCRPAERAELRDLQKMF